MTERTGQTTDYTGQNTEFSVTSKAVEGTPAAKEARYTPNFNRWHGYYRNIPEIKAVINKLVSWTFGRGIIADAANKKKLDKIKGNGKESARTVLKNQWRTALICGDSFAHIIKDNQGRLTNLKPLNPQSVAVVVNDRGIITGYEQESSGRKFDVDEIFHLSFERVADELHGIPFLESLESRILSTNEALADLRTLYHRNIQPINWIEVETDDTTKLTQIENTINAAYKNTENIVIPTGVVKEIKKQSTGQYTTLDSLPYLKFLVRQFVTSCGMPEVIMGWGAETSEASSKVIYLAFQQEIEDKQRYNEEQIEDQLNIKIKLEFPASIEEELQKDQKKDANYQTDVKVGSANKDTK